MGESWVENGTEFPVGPGENEPSPEEVRDLLSTVEWMLRQERNDIISTPGRLTDLAPEKVRRLEHLYDVDRQVRAMLKRLPPPPPMSEERMEKVGAVVGAALRKRFGEGSAEEVAAAVEAAWPAVKPAEVDRSDHAVWCCVDHPGSACGDQCPACAGPLDIDNEVCCCGYDGRRPWPANAKPTEEATDG